MKKNDHRSPTINCKSMSVDDQQQLRSLLIERGTLREFNDLAAPLENFLFYSATSIYEFFHSNGYMILRNEWEEKTIHSAFHQYIGWIYAFYGKDESPIYIGETGRTFVDRFNEHNIKEQPWWADWEAAKVLPCPNKTMRKIFESLIGFAGGYEANKTQPAGVDNILDDIILSLLLLGNESNTRPIFPNKMIFNQIEALRSNLNFIDVNKKTFQSVD